MRRGSASVPEVSPEVKLSSADRVLFPDDGVTKGDLFAYYDKVSGAIVPHLYDRPFTMKRWREGLPGGAFFQKQAPKGMPEWIPTRQFKTTQRGGKGATRMVDFPLVNSREALLWMVQMHCIDMNAWYSRVDLPDRPDYVLFDLDPPEEPDAFALCVRVAHHVRGRARRARARARTSRPAARTASTSRCRSCGARPTVTRTSSPSCWRAGSRRNTPAM